MAFSRNPNPRSFDSFLFSIMPNVTVTFVRFHGFRGFYVLILGGGYQKWLCLLYALITDAKNHITKFLGCVMYNPISGELKYPLLLGFLVYWETRSV